VTINTQASPRVPWRWLVLALALLGPAAVAAAAGPPTPPAPPDLTEINPILLLEDAGALAGQPERGLSTTLNILVMLTVLTLAPSILILCTCFTRIIIVLSLLRQALGTQTLPPSQVITGLSILITLVVMAPVAERMYVEGLQPYAAGEQQDYRVAWERTRQPLRDFMFDQIAVAGNESTIYLMLNYQGVDTSRPEQIQRADVSTLSLVPAYVLSELKVAFLIGFRMYLPFLVIDMVIASMLISMGMLMLPPVLISLPFKLLLFVLVDGWQLVVGTLMTSVQTGDGTGAAVQAGAMALGLG